MPTRRTLPLALLSLAALVAAPAQAEEVDPCEVDVGQCDLTGTVQDCLQGEIDLCNTDDNVVQDCLQWELPACAIVWNEVQYCLNGPSPICRQVDACVDGEPGLCQQALDEVGQCLPLDGGGDTCDDVWRAYTSCGEPGGACYPVIGVVIECLGNDHPSPAPCKEAWAEANACLGGGPGACSTATACVRSDDPCPVHHDRVAGCAMLLVRERQVCDDV